MGNALKQGNISSCGKCMPSKGEFTIKTILEQNDKIFDYDTVFPLLLQETGRRLRFDFIVYTNDGQIDRFIEFDGRQHVTGPERVWGDSSSLQEIQERDTIKNNFCKKHGYKLIRIPYDKLKSLTAEDLFSDKYELR